MASQTRSGRNVNRPALLAEEQWRPEDQQRRRERRRRLQREQLNGEQLLIEDGDVDLEEDELEFGNEEEQVDGGVGNEEEYGNLAERREAQVPETRVTLPEEECLDGWHIIDKLGAEECFHCTFPTMQDVPGGFQLIWTQALATVLTREVEAESSLAKQRALKWFCFLSQGLLRTQRRGAKAGVHVAVGCG